MGGEKKAVKDLKDGLKKFREEALKKGWEEDEVDAKITEVYENFPWYQYKKQPRSWKSRFGYLLLYSLIIYLAYGAFMQRNRRFKKKVDDFIFDSQLIYHSQRVLRIATLPLFNIFDLSKFHEADCLVRNPFREKEAPDCSFCEGISEIPSLSIESTDVVDMIAESEPLILKDVPNYFDKKVTFDDFKNVFKENSKELDLATCSMETNNEFDKISKYFEEYDEPSLVAQNISLKWSNCDTYGTRFYRSLFSRPDFVLKESEIHFEKRVFMQQKGENSTYPNFEGKSYYHYQVQGESEFEMFVMPTCHHNCTSDSLRAVIKAGEVAVFPNNGWETSFKSTGDGLNIAFLSSFT